MPYIPEDTIKAVIETGIPVVANIEEKCIACNKKDYGTMLAIHMPDMIGLCHDCYKQNKYDPEQDYIEHNGIKVYGSRAMYKIGRGFIPNIYNGDHEIYSGDAEE